MVKELDVDDVVDGSHAPENLHDDPALLRLHTTLKIANSSISCFGN